MHHQQATQTQKAQKNYLHKVLHFIALLFLLTLSLPSAVHAGPVLQRIQSNAVVKVCIWPEYYGITFRNPRTQQLGGIDIDFMGLPPDQTKSIAPWEQAPR